MTEWRPIEGWEKYYEVSDEGQVRSLDRMVQRGRGRPYLQPGRVMRPHRHGFGYPMVDLKAEGRKSTKTIHRLVLLAFVGPPPNPDDQCRHRNGDPSDSRLTNLQWGTPKENSADMVEHGTVYQANKTHCPQGHLLEGPNLQPGRLPNRVCRSCPRQDADAYYARLMEGYTPVPLGERTHCPRGHSLVEPNLVRSRLPRRTCLACSQAKSREWIAVRAGYEFDLQADADEAYRQIMAGNAPIPPKEKTHCVRGHLLQQPNLTARSIREGYRNCKACHRAQASSYYAERMGRPFDLQAESDSRYKKIMAGSAHAVAPRRDAAQSPSRAPAQRGPSSVAHLVRDSAATGERAR